MTEKNVQNAAPNQPLSDNKPPIDPVEQASIESFPASDPPGWVSHKAEEVANENIDTTPLDNLRLLASSEAPDQKEHYKAILDLRDRIMTQAVVEVARALVKASGYTPDPQTNVNKNNQIAIAAMEDYLSKSSIPDIDQQLIALTGTGSLFGWKVDIEKEDEGLRLYPTESKELNPQIMLRLARAVYRSPEQEALLWPIVDLALKDEPDAPLIKAAIKATLDETPMNKSEYSMGEMIVQSVMGG